MRRTGVGSTSISAGPCCRRPGAAIVIPQRLRCRHASVRVLKNRMSREWHEAVPFAKWSGTAKRSAFHLRSVRRLDEVRETHGFLSMAQARGALVRLGCSCLFCVGGRSSHCALAMSFRPRAAGNLVSSAGRQASPAFRAAQTVRQAGKFRLIQGSCIYVAGPGAGRTVADNAQETSFRDAVT